MATSTAAIATAVVTLAMSIIRRTRWNSAACSGVCSGKSISLMQGSSSNGAGRREITADGSEGSARLDRVLSAHLADLSRSRLKALILAGQVSIKKPAAGAAPVSDPAYHVAPGETIII